MADAITLEVGRDSQAVFNKANVVGFLVAVATSSFYSFSAAEGSALAKDYLSEVLQPKHFELLVYVLMILQGAAMATASRSFPAISKSLLEASGIVLTMYVGIVGAIFGWGLGALLADWSHAPYGGYAILGMFLLMCSVLLHGATSAEYVVRRLTGFSVRERKREGLVRMLGLLLGLYGSFALTMYLGML